MPDDQKPDPSDVADFIANPVLREQIFMLHLSGLTWREACKECLPPLFDALIAGMLERKYPGH